MSGVCAASDIWSVGCTVIELLTCVPPYYDLQPMPALFRIVQVCPSVFIHSSNHCYQNDRAFCIACKSYGVLYGNFVRCTSCLDSSSYPSFLHISGEGIVPNHPLLVDCYHSKCLNCIIFCQKHFPYWSSCVFEMKIYFIIS